MNLGSTTPGRLPGEVSARAVAYRRWLPEMAAVGIKVIRVYTLLDPSFYSELRRAPRRGMASGRWTADISRWVIAWSPGVKWDPAATADSEKKNPPRGYGWEPWQRVTWHERGRAGWATLRAAFAEAVR